jgi:Ni,Fe-hydrogenase III large subunit
LTDPAPLRARNCEALPREAVPLVPLDAFRAEVIASPSRNRRVAALFGLPGRSGGLELLAVIAADQEGTLDLVRTAPEGASFPSMTPACPEVHLFEREIAETWGLVPEGHPWPKPVRFLPRGRDSVVGVTHFYRIEGEEIHEVAVGPVHAGVIEPGHFRFQCHGEHVFHLEISLGYQHRGVERALAGGPGKRTLHYMETLAGDTSVGHATAYCHAVEALSGCRVSARAHALRAIGLELERLANHTGNLGALAGDVGFLPSASYCGRLRGDFLNLTAEICGSRFGRGLVRPGGVGFDVDPDRAGRMRERLDAAAADVESAVALLMGTASVQARFEDTGRVDAGAAAELGLVGVAARASGLGRDVRHDFPTGMFRFTQIPLSVWHSGDVFARAQVRWKEIQRSVAFVRARLARLPGGAGRSGAVAGSGALLAPCPALQPDRICVSLVEGTRGEICHVAVTDGAGRFAAYKVIDPSFHNWSGLAMALRDQQISDFPLCNKSFDLSYCGYDL